MFESNIVKQQRSILLGISLERRDKCNNAVGSTQKAGRLFQNQWRTKKFCSGGECLTNSVEDRERGSGGGNPLVWSLEVAVICNLVQEISFHIVKIFLIFGILRLFIMTTNLSVIANVKQLRTGGSFRILLPFFPNISLQFSQSS